VALCRLSEPSLLIDQRGFCFFGKSDDTQRSWILGMGGRNEAKLIDDGVENRLSFATVFCEKSDSNFT